MSNGLGCGCGYMLETHKNPLKNKKAYKKTLKKSSQRIPTFLRSYDTGNVCSDRSVLFHTAIV